MEPVGLDPNSGSMYAHWANDSLFLGLSFSICKCRVVVYVPCGLQKSNDIIPLKCSMWCSAGNTHPSNVSYSWHQAHYNPYYDNRKVCYCNGLSTLSRLGTTENIHNSLNLKLIIRPALWQSRLAATYNTSTSCSPCFSTSNPSSC